ncbi:MAG: 5-formyltetrahydrofolate cyclo-ligase [Lachnospiraceae bacterium]|jgi:5-formyltetrahydrofolate cyclo-ligase|nr:5-formyltetrahydrofolate cyclo-ligase [Lachnospiraceae bacterium]
MTKQQLRKKMNEKRDQYAYTHRDSIRIWDLLEKSPLYQQAHTIFAYFSFRSEVETYMVMEHALRYQKALCLPRIEEGHRMEFYLQEDRSSFQRNRFGIYEPAPWARRQEPDQKTLMLVPGLAFDYQGGRIGYGSGFYDRYLERYRFVKTVGLCFDFQLQEEALEMDEKDFRMQYIAAPKGIYCVEKGEWL